MVDTRPAIDDYLSVDANAIYRFSDNVSAELKVTNLFDEDGSVVPEEFGSIANQDLPLIGRTAYFRLRFSY